MSARYNSYSYAYLLMAVHKSKNDLKAAKRYPFVECLSILLYSALAFEAFLNHLGREVFPHWTPIKRKLSPIEKLEILSAAKGVEVEWGRRPYQSVSLLMAFRNAVAHAESTEINTELISGEAREKTKHWQSFCTSETALRLGGDIELLIQTLPDDLGIEMPKLSTLAEPVRRATSAK